MYNGVLNSSPTPTLTGDNARGEANISRGTRDDSQRAEEERERKRGGGGWRPRPPQLLQMIQCKAQFLTNFLQHLNSNLDVYNTNILTTFKIVFEILNSNSNTT